MMQYGDIVGQPALVANLRDSMQSGRAVHAYFFSGPYGTGKRTLADICARALVCEGEAGGRPCGACPSCRRALAGNHPDILTLAPAKQTIGVDEVRALLDKLSMRPYEGGRQVVIIQRADALTTQAQNALLKTLESPPGDVVFFLLSESPYALLPTVLSRTMAARFTPITPEGVERALINRGVDGERARALAADADGSVGRALDLHGDATYYGLRREVSEALRGLRAGEDPARRAAAFKAKKEDAPKILDILERLGREALGTTPAFGIKLLRAVMRGRRMMKSNVAWAQVIEILFMDIGG